MSQTARRVALHALAFVVIMVVLVMLGAGDRQPPTRHHRPAATCYTPGQACP